jgi:mevalonate pyrophosphate decarboxylase
MGEKVKDINKIIQTKDIAKLVEKAMQQSLESNKKALRYLAER